MIGRPNTPRKPALGNDASGVWGLREATSYRRSGSWVVIPTTKTTVSQKQNWYGNSSLATEDTQQSSDAVDNAIKIQPSTTEYSLYSYIDTGEPWLGKVITGYSNLRIETKIEVKRDQDGSFLTPPIVLAGSSVQYRALRLVGGGTVATLGTDDHTQFSGGSGNETRIAIDNTAITGALTDSEIKTWLSEGCPLRHIYFDDTESDGGNTATVDTPELFWVRILADSITYIDE